MDIIIAIVVGLIAGWLAGIIMKGSGYGIIGDIILGLLGSIVGNWIFSFLGITSHGTLWTIIVAVNRSSSASYISCVLSGI